MGRLNWKIVLFGGVVFYAVQWIVSMLTGPFIHEGVLEPLYMANESFWRPELVQDPPDMAALMPRWITTGLLCAFVMAALYCFVRRAFDGAGWVKGAKYGLVLAILMACWGAAWSGIFNLPDAIWFWWGLEGFAYFILGGIALGWVAQWLAPEGTGA